MRAEERAAAIVDPGSFVPRLGLEPELPLVLGSGRVAGRSVVLALADGHHRGGTFGVAEATVLDALLADLRAPTAGDRASSPALVFGFDTGGVRVEEGPAALAAVSATGVALARLVASGVPVLSLISGPRGCFGAPSVMAALPQFVIMTEGAHWGLTGPRLIEEVRGPAAGDGRDASASSAPSRLANGDVDAVVVDAPGAVRQAVIEGMTKVAAGKRDDRLGVIARSRDVCADLARRLRAAPEFRPQVIRTARHRDLLRYSFRGQWRPEGEVSRTPLVHAALGRIGDRSALSLIVGPEQAEGVGVGIEEAALVTEMVARAAEREGPPAAILTFVFCQGHVVDFAQERFGLPRALAECLRALVAARMRGHPILTTLGGGTYGAAYLAFAAPSHRVLALQGTSVAPMAPDVLQAFQSLRGRKAGHEADTQRADRIPAVRTVESIIRLPRILREELESILGANR